MSVCLSVCLSTGEHDLWGRLTGLQSLSELLLSSPRYFGPVVILGVDVGAEPLPETLPPPQSLLFTPIWLTLQEQN